VETDAFVAPNASVIGRVAIGTKSSVWYGAVIRGDLNDVKIGRYSAVRERAVITTTKSVEGHVDAVCSIGDHVLIGACARAGGASPHAPFRPWLSRPRPSPDPPLPSPSRLPPHPAGPGALLQSCVIENQAEVGAGAVIMEGALVEKGARVGEGAVVHPGRRIPAGQLWAGNPAVFVRDLEKGELASAEGHAEEVAEAAEEHAHEFLPVTSAYRQAEALGKA
jgi:carbonic anhydrase/acetyltransferase-like protein (isoleucine patch superfamily)